MDWPSRLVNIAGLFVIGGFFVFSLPLWRPLTWSAVYSLLLLWRTWYCLRIDPDKADALDKALRMTRIVCMTWSGSAAYFLFVPDNLLMHVVLALSLVTIASMVTLEIVGDSRLAVISLFLVLIPTGVRFLFQESMISVLMGCGAFLTGPVLWLLWSRQQAIWQEQAVLRQQAELAAQALSESTLARARFFAAANHDLRQPVHAMGIYLDMLRTQALDTRGQEALKGLNNAWQALSGLLTQLMDVSRAEAGALSPQLAALSVTEVFQEQIQHYQALAGSKNIRLVTLAHGPGWVLADRLMLARCLGNLLDNAIKFSAPDSSVVLAARAGEGGVIRLQVRDAGEGIALDEQAHVFDDFVQVGNYQRDRAQGFGLGLAIVKRFAQAMNGSVNLYSKPGHGSVFELRLPRADALLPVPAATAIAPLQADAASGADRAVLPALPVLPLQRLLLLEDDELVANAMAAVCQTWGVACSVFEDGALLLGQAQAGDVALCDIRLPSGPSGIEVAGQLLQRGIAAALVTGEVDTATRQQIDQMGLELLLKPVNPAHLHATLSRLAAKRAS